MHEARALNAYLLAELDRSRAGTDEALDTRVTLKEGGQGSPQMPPEARAERGSFSTAKIGRLTKSARRAILVERARQAKTYAGQKGRQ